MLTNLRLLALLVFTLIVLPDVGHSQWPLNVAHCPGFDSRKSWRNYFSKERNEVSIVFSESDNVPASEPWKGRCLIARFEVSKNRWQVNGYYRNRREAQITYFYPNNTFENQHWDKKWRYSNGVSQWSDPTKFEIPVLGGRFNFNEAGEVIHKIYGRVGYLKCYHPNTNNPCVLPVR